ncbi:hypothetical protein AAZX31_20G075300 [Glycine max]
MDFRWQDHRRQITSAPSTSFSSLAFYVGNNTNNCSNKFKGLLGLKDDDLGSTVVLVVTIMLEGCSIYQRISLHNHDSTSDDDLDHSNAILGHLIAYEDMENNLLLAGDLIKRIDILPIRGNSKKSTRGAYMMIITCIIWYEEVLFM